MNSYPLNFFIIISNNIISLFGDALLELGRRGLADQVLLVLPTEPVGDPDQERGDGQGRDAVPGASAEGAVEPETSRRQEQTDSEYMREKYEGYMREVPCGACQGSRLKPEILAVTLAHGTKGDRSIADVSAMSVRECSEFLGDLKLGRRESMIAGRVLKEIQEQPEAVANTLRGHLVDGTVGHYQVTLKVGFRLDDDD